MKTKYLLQGICAVVLFAGANAYGQGKVADRSISTIAKVPSLRRKSREKPSP